MICYEFTSPGSTVQCSNWLDIERQVILYYDTALLTMINVVENNIEMLASLVGAKDFSVKCFKVWFNTKTTYLFSY